MKLYAIVISAAVALIPPFAQAGYAGGVKIKRIRSEGNALFISTVAQPPSTCTYYGESLRFDISPATSSTDNQLKQKALIAMLMMAKANDKYLEIWYAESSAPNTTEANGCNPATSAVLIEVSMPQTY